MSLLRAYIAMIDRLNYGVGRVIMYGVFAMMAVLLWSTISKFSEQPSLWTLEVAQFAMIAYFFLGGPYAIQMRSHVRMDLFYENWSMRKKAAIDAVMVFCLLFYLGVLLWGGLSSTAYSLGHFGSNPLGFFVDLATGEKDLGTLERSRTIWRPYLWPIKTIMCVGVFLMLLQGLSELAKDILRLRGETI
ncbi:MAG: TRAP transporter small permease subunit [Alphaproteobacteria bacterium]|nr:TRAP transporter small permease subunit [Alphaproteobacteria bacterium]